jgi:hypothetical protein
MGGGRGQGRWRGLRRLRWAEWREQPRSAPDTHLDLEYCPTCHLATSARTSFRPTFKRRGCTSFASSRGELIASAERRGSDRRCPLRLAQEPRCPSRGVHALLRRPGAFRGLILTEMIDRLKPVLLRRHQDSPEGIDVCLTCYNGGCTSEERHHARSHWEKSGHPMVVNIRRTRKPGKERVRLFCASTVAVLLTKSRKRTMLTRARASDLLAPG